MFFPGISNSFILVSSIGWGWRFQLGSLYGHTSFVWPWNPLVYDLEEILPYQIFTYHPPPTCNYISLLRRNYFHMVQRVVKVSLIPTTNTGLIHKKYTFSRSFPSFAFLKLFKYTRTNLQLMYHISSCGKLWTVILMIGINDVCSTNLGHIPVLFFPQENLLGPGTSIVDTIQILNFLRCTQFTQKLMCG